MLWTWWLWAGVIPSGWQPAALRAADPEVLTDKARYITAQPEVGVDQIIQLMRQDPSRFKVLGRINRGFTEDVYWVIIPIRMTGTEPEQLLELANPHVDHAQAWRVDTLGIHPIGPAAGDALTFRQRIIHHRNLVWPLHPGASSEFVMVLRVDKRNTSLDLPLFIWTQDAFWRHYEGLDLFYGLCFGVLFLIALFALAGWVALRERLYVWFLARIVFGAMIIAGTEGISFQWLYPNVPDFNGGFRMVVNALEAASVIAFARAFLNTAACAPRLHRVMGWLFYFQLALVLTLPLTYNFYSEHRIIVVPLALVVALLVRMLSIAAGVVTFRDHSRLSAFYLAAYGITFVFGAVMILEDLGFIEYISFNPLFPSIFLEMTILAVGISYQIKLVYDEKNMLALRNSQHESDRIRAYVEGVDKERYRIAGELHDDLGSRLSNLRRVFGHDPVSNREYIEKQIEILCNDVRTLSHRLSHVASSRETLQQRIEALLKEVQSGTPTVFGLQCYGEPERLTDEMIIQLYRMVQEAINNIIRHADATHAEIQMFGYEHELVVTVEDDGKGFEAQRPGAGLGLSQLRSRALALKGTVEISSRPGKGTSIMITVPLPAKAATTASN